MRLLSLAAVVVLAACGVPGLTAEDVLVQHSCPAQCPGAQVCSADGACVEAAALTGSVEDACTGAAIAARVTIAGRSVCSGDGKLPYFELTGLVPGGPYTLAVGKLGYRSYTVARSLEPGANTHPAIALTPSGGCGAPPAPIACTCTDALCQR
jgi:hypothetical protein